MERGSTSEFSLRSNGQLSGKPTDSEDEDTIWITEVWENIERHKKSNELPSVQETMKQGRPLISEFNKQIEMEPIGGHGLGPKEN